MQARQGGAQQIGIGLVIQRHHVAAFQQQGLRVRQIGVPRLVAAGVGGGADQDVVGVGVKLAVVLRLSAAEAVQIAQGGIAVAVDIGQHQREFAAFQGGHHILRRHGTYGDADAQLLAPDGLQRLGHLGVFGGILVQQRHRVHMLQRGGGITGAAQQLRRLLAPLVVFLRIVVDGRAVGLPEGLALRGGDAVGDQPVGGAIDLVARHGQLRQGVAVDHQGHGLAHALAQAGGHLVHQHHADRGGGGLHRALRLTGIQHEIGLVALIQRHGLAAASGIEELQPVGAHAAHIVVFAHHGGGQAVLIHRGHGVGAVGQQRGGGHGPVGRRGVGAVSGIGGIALLGLCHLGAHRHGGHRRTHHRQEIGAVAVDDHHEGAVVIGPGLQRRRIAGHRIGIARHHVQDGGVGRVGLRIHQPLPGVGKVVGGDLLPVRPVDVAAQCEGVGLGAVHIVHIGIAGGLSGHHTAGGGGLHQVFKQLGGHSLFRLGHGHGGVQRAGRVRQRGAHRHVLRLRRAAGAQRQRHTQRQQEGYKTFGWFHGFSPLCWGCKEVRRGRRPRRPVVYQMHFMHSRSVARPQAAVHRKCHRLPCGGVRAPRPTINSDGRCVHRAGRRGRRPLRVCCT